ncbi:hypothetical protein ABT174_37975 [Streptomyces sparsogenes]|uniref:hypothetical protein n=1 Tax=Streptomyces sparsogenes TaxID=67365 RepID=UPI00331DD4CB
MPDIVGQLPLRVEVPITVEVTWSLKVTSGGQQSTAIENRDFIAPQGLQNPTLDLRLVPPFFELSRATLLNPPRFKYTIGASVTLTVAVPGGSPKSSGPVSLPEISISAPGVGIPTIAVFFRHASYAPYDPPPLENPGWAFVVLPTDTPLIGSPLDTLSREDLLSSIGEPSQLLLPIAGLVPAIDFMLGGLALLSGALSAFGPDRGNEEEPRVGIWIRNEILDLNGEDPLDFGIYHEISSMILISAEKRGVRIFNDDDNHGRFAVFARQGVAAIADFDGRSPTADPHFRSSTWITDVQTPSDRFNDQTAGLRYIYYAVATPPQP